MESISRRGKVFTGKFATLAVKIGIAQPVGSEPKAKPKRKPKTKK